jgi:hypothetical protein
MSVVGSGFFFLLLISAPFRHNSSGGTDGTIQKTGWSDATGQMGRCLHLDVVVGCLHLVLVTDGCAMGCGTIRVDGFSIMLGAIPAQPKKVLVPR